MKKILIPTDFSIESLRLLEYALINFPRTKLEIILVNGFKLPPSRWGMYHFSNLNQINELAPDVFIKAAQDYVREHKGEIEKFSIELFTGTNTFAFANFLEKLDVHDAVIPEGKLFKQTNNKCFDVTPYIVKSLKNVIEAPVGLRKVQEAKSFSFAGILNF